MCLSSTCRRALTVENFWQDTFYGLHLFYLRRKGVYVLMFNMEWFLPGHSCDKCNGGPNHLYFLAFWLDSIAAHAVDANEDPEIAPIILVGTHKDRVSSSADHVMISEMLDKTFSGKPAWSSVERFKKAKVISGRGALWFFPVDNTIGNKDPVMVHIQEVVLERVKKERYVNEKVPFAWLKVLEQLQNVDKGSSITLQQVLTIGKDCGLPRTAEESLEGEAMKMLKRFNDLGQLIAVDCRKDARFGGESCCANGSKP